MCEITKIPKIYYYNRDKMGITQNEVVWNQNTGGEISLCREFSYHSKNFAMRAKFRYHSENTRHREFKFSLCTVTFAMIANFLYDNEISLS